MSDIQFDPTTLGLLSAVCNHLGRSGVQSTLCHDEIYILGSGYTQLQGDTLQQYAAHAARTVIRFRLDWLITHSDNARAQYWNLRDMGCMWSAVRLTVAEHEHAYHVWVASQYSREGE